MPSLVTPASTEDAAESMRDTPGAVLFRGAGTKQDWGHPPRHVDLIVDTGRLTGVVEHAAGDLIVVVRAGTPMAELAEKLAPAGQQLALDVPLPGASVGGTVAVNTSGPRRMLYGTVRDLLIGVTIVRADGVVAKAGGKVVKNVAGYDLGKLLTGSYGTLGLIVELAVRLHPRPQATATAVGRSDESAALARAAAAAAHAPLEYEALDVRFERGEGAVLA